MRGAIVGAVALFAIRASALLVAPEMPQQDVDASQDGERTYLPFAIPIPDADIFTDSILNTTDSAREQELADAIRNNPEDSGAALHELLRRQTCAQSCGSGLCCPANTICSTDNAGNIACCPVNAVCTGTIGGFITGTQTTSTVFGAASTTSVSSVSFVLASTTTTAPFVQATTTNGIIVAGTSTVAVIPGSGATGVSTPLVARLIVAVSQMLLAVLPY